DGDTTAQRTASCVKVGASGTGRSRVTGRSRATGSRATGQSRSMGQSRTTGRTEQSGTLTNTRTKLVGNREGFLADLVVTLVKLGRVAGRVARAALGRAVSVVTPLGWSMIVVVPLALVFGY